MFLCCIFRGTWQTTIDKLPLFQRYEMQLHIKWANKEAALTRANKIHLNLIFFFCEFISCVTASSLPSFFNSFVSQINSVRIVFKPCQLLKMFAKIQIHENEVNKCLPSLANVRIPIGNLRSLNIWLNSIDNNDFTRQNNPILSDDWHKHSEKSSKKVWQRQG